MRERDFDVKAFPRHHPTGKYGLHHPRADKISPQQFFNQRLLNFDQRFAQDATYVFMSQQYVERANLESQIDLSVQRGIMTEGPDGTKVMSLAEAFSVFQKVPGTPKYWQSKRSDLLATISVLGPFQFFFTLSCGEMRWTEVIVSVLKKEGHDVVIINPDTPDEEVIIDNESLEVFLDKTGQTIHSLLKNYTFLITRMFNNRVKSFIKNVLLSKEKEGLKIEYYTYRVEFQMRGSAHIHGCC